MTFAERLRALGWFLLGAAWFLFADLVSFRAANGITEGDLQDPLYRIFLLFLLILGYRTMSRVGQPRKSGARATGLAVRPGWGREWALGAALGWGGVVACVLPAALIGGLVVRAFTNPHQFWMIAVDVVALGAGTLAIEAAFRGYPFQRLTEAMGSAVATLFQAVVYALWWTRQAPATAAMLLTAFLLGWALALGALRTRALWVSWGLHFAWAAAIGILFGLPLAGPLSYSPVIVTNSHGPTWVTGDGQGPESSLFGVLAAAALVIAVMWGTSDLKYKFGFDEIVPGGIPVDLDAAARQQHEAAMAQAEPAEPKLVQILPAPGASVMEPGGAAEEERPEPEST
ncbi:MAG TPA: CPBP family intramembrane glutamic endopeptidase [Acidobacteriaceae bacterium]|nr:CPBP family intramembrane glutamic endopeptidase [Acidobacteriaceae bacterium]